MAIDESLGEGEDLGSGESSLPNDPPDGNPSDSRGTANDSMSERTVLLGCFGTLVVIGLLIWGVVAAVGWVRGDNDPNKEGSYAWCAAHRVSRDFCNELNDASKALEIPVAELLADAIAATPKEGSYEWCSNRGLTKTECDDVNTIAREFGETPTYVYQQLNQLVDMINNG